MRGIYEGRNIFTDDAYFGQSVNMGRRIKRHIRALKNNKHDNDFLQRARNKYGKSAFVCSPIEIVEDLTIDLTPIEKKYWNSTTNKYNIADPEKPLFLSPESRKKLSNSLLGHKVSEETKQKISMANKGHKYALGLKRSLETKKNMSLAQIACGNIPPSQKGVKRSQETIQKLKQAWADKRAAKVAI